MVYKHMDVKHEGLVTHAVFYDYIHIEEKEQNEYTNWIFEFCSPGCDGTLDFAEFLQTMGKNYYLNGLLEGNMGGIFSI